MQLLVEYISPRARKPVGSNTVDIWLLNSKTGKQMVWAMYVTILEVVFATKQRVIKACVRERRLPTQVDYDDLTTLASIPPVDKKQSRAVSVDRAALTGDKIGSV